MVYAELSEEEKIKVLNEYADCLICLDINKINNKIGILDKLHDRGVEKFGLKKREVKKELEKLEYILTIID